ncbi:MAG TPA: class I SAM-dependent methyltransferase [Marinobacter sp.]|uniref:Class I SAM-dependent methyltransferase n=1 Tax=marine sediment metagenome TaxID=412755 RepID=A0A0F9REC1_9ZZZZ|nr:class I SAM-dependent methyltransferase [Marinobacter sp.]
MAAHLGEVKSVRLHFPSQPGPIPLDQVGDADRATLRALARGKKTVIEIGTFFGGSAEALLEGMPDDGHLTCIDTFEGTAGSPTDPVNYRSEKIDFTKELVLSYLGGRLRPYHGRVNIVVGESLSVVRDFEPESADLIFLDGAHDYENVLADIQAWLPIVKSDGILCGHDYDRFGEALPVEKIEEFSSREYKPIPIDSPDPLRGHEELLVKVMDGDGEQVGHAVNVHFGVLRAVRESFETVALGDNISSCVWAAKPEWKI